MLVSTAPRKRLPAAWAVLSIALALLFVLVSAVILFAWKSYDSAIERARERVASASQVVATHVEWLTAAGLLIMDEVDHLIGEDANTVRAGASEELRLHLRHMPKGVTVSLVDPQGRLLYSEGGKGSPLDHAAGLTMSELTAKRPWYVSALLEERGTGEKVFLIARRIERGQKLIGAAVVKFPVEVMSVVWRSLELGPGSTVGLLRDDGWQVARHPPIDKPVNLASYVLFTDYLKSQSSGVYDAVSPVDGETRIVGYRKVPNAPLVAISSTTRSFALNRLYEQMQQLVLFLIPILLGLGLLSIWVVRLLQRDEKMRASLAAAVERNNLLMREIHHRTKNNLQSVASLLKLQPISEEAKSAMTARIAAMSALHEQAYRSDQYSDVDLREYLLSLVDSIHKTSSGNVDIATDLTAVSIDRDLAQPLGLIVNEVISNAMKHAFPGRADGRITVELAALSSDRAELVIRDNGRGFTPNGSESGMGSRLIRAFAQQLGNDFSYESENGTRFSIRFSAKPLSVAS